MPGRGQSPQSYEEPAIGNAIYHTSILFELVVKLFSNQPSLINRGLS